MAFPFLTLRLQPVHPLLSLLQNLQDLLMVLGESQVLLLPFPKGSLVEAFEFTNALLEIEQGSRVGAGGVGDARD